MAGVTPDHGSWSSQVFFIEREGSERLRSRRLQYMPQSQESVERWETNMQGRGRGGGNPEIQAIFAIGFDGT